MSDPRGFVLAQTAVAHPPLVPEIRLRLASEVMPLWRATEADLEDLGLPPPYWAFAWPGGQALARYLLDRPDVVTDRRVLDFAAGSGIQGIAAALSGAAEVTACDIDPFALAAIESNAKLNDTLIAVDGSDLMGSDHGWDVVLAGDVCYESAMSDAVVPWLRSLATRGAKVLLGDPGRSYLPRSGLKQLITYAVRTSRDLEDGELRNSVVWQVRKYR